MMVAANNLTDAIFVKAHVRNGLRSPLALAFAGFLGALPILHCWFYSHLVLLALLEDIFEDQDQEVEQVSKIVKLFLF